MEMVACGIQSLLMISLKAVKVEVKNKGLGVIDTLFEIPFLQFLILWPLSFIKSCDIMML